MRGRRRPRRCRRPRGWRGRRRGRAAGVLGQHRPGQQCGQEVPSTNAPRSSMKKHRSASPSQAMPRSACLDHLAHDELAVLGQHRIGLVVGEVAIGLPVGLLEIEAQAIEQRADHRRGHAVAAVDDHPQRLDRRGSMSSSAARGTRRRFDVSTEPPPGRVAQAVLDLRRGRHRSRVARERDRPAPDQLGAGVGAWGCGRRCTSGRRRDRAIRRGNTASRCRPPGVEHVAPSATMPSRYALGELGRGQAHVPAEPEAELRGAACLRARRSPARTPARSPRPRSPSICSPYRPRMS